MRLLDRYIVRNFLQPFAYCILGFLSIWLIFDISDNSSTIFDERAPLLLVLRFYWTQIPQVLVILLPVALLLALLFSLGRMSRANEIVSMLTAGVSVPRVVMPLLFIGLLTTGATFALNYSLAAHAELARKNFFDEVNRGGMRDVVIAGQVFRNRTDNRTWYIPRFRPNSNQFSGVQIVQQDADGNITQNYLATEAFYEAATKSWRLVNAKLVKYDPKGNITDEKVVKSTTISHWSETPFRLTSANVRPEFLGISELQEYLYFNADFPETLLAPFRTQLQYRWALPVDLLRGRGDGDAARDWLFAPRNSGERGGGDRTCFYHEFPDPPFSCARRRRSDLARGGRLDPECDFSGRRPRSASSARHQSRDAQL